MKLNALRALVAAIEEGSVRAAARRIGVSQPALSKLLRELELELNAPLLVRTSRGVLPTAQGQVMCAHAQKIDKELSVATDQVRQLGGDMRGHLHIGAVPLAVMLLIPEVLRTFGRAYPHITLHVQEELYFSQLQRLRAGQMDIAVCGIPQGLPPGDFVCEELMTTTMVVVAKTGSDVARVRSLRDLRHAKWVYTGSAHDSGYAQQLFESHGLVAPPVASVVNSTLALLALVGAGDHVAMLPRQMAQHPLMAPYISVVPVVEQGLPLTVGAIIRRDSVVSPATRHFIAHLHRAAHHIHLP